jgi:hypothetical protein
MRRMWFLTAALAVCASTMSACGAATPTEKQATTTTTTAPTTTTTEGPHPTATVAFFFESQSSNYFRFAAPIVNPGPLPLVGVTVTWTAVDATGAIVGSFVHHCPPINGNSTFMYVGGAGSALLSGVPAKVTTAITDPGQYVMEPAPSFPVSSIQLTQSPYQDGSPNATTYEVTADVTIGGSVAVQSASLDIPITLTNASGAIVGADFYVPDNLPATLSPGAVIRVDDSDVDATSAPTAAAVSAGVDPSS